MTHFRIDRNPFLPIQVAILKPPFRLNSSRSGFFHQFDLILRQPIESIDPLVNLPLRIALGSTLPDCRVLLQPLQFPAQHLRVFAHEAISACRGRFCGRRLISNYEEACHIVPVVTRPPRVDFDARQEVARQVDSTLAMLHWRIGQRIRRDILKEKRAEYGAEILQALSAKLTAEFGRGFSEKSLRHMVRFAEAFPAWKLSRHC